MFTFIVFVKISFMKSESEENNSIRHQLANTVFSKYAKAYEERFMYEDMYNSSYDALLKELPANAKVLELGCGPGNITKYLMDKLPGLNYTATDISKEMLNLSMKNNPSAKHLLLNVTELHILNDSYDAIVCGFAFPYLNQEEINYFFNECERLLNKKGLIYLSFILSEDFKCSEEKSSKGDEKVFVFQYSANNIEELRQNNSFLLKEEFCYSFKNNKGIDEIHCAQILTK